MQPDTQPGPYYVSAIDGPKSALVSGPYADHATALALVDRARDIASDNDPRAWFAAFGTVRMKPEVNQPGVLQTWGYNLELTERA
jgi:hypothetical protein